MIDEKKLIEDIREIQSICGGIGIDFEAVIGIVKEQPKVGEWIPSDNPPKDDNYILLSFANFSLPLVGRYEKDGEGGAYYVGDCDEEDTCTANDLFVNAWQPLPEPYRPKGELEV